MQTEVPVILVSHGPLCSGRTSCAEMLIGEQHNIAVVSLQPESNINDVRATLLENLPGGQ